MSEPPARILKQLAKAALVVVGSAIAVPYTLAILTNILYGWPQKPDRYKRALHPRKVYRLNYAILQQLGNVRYAKLIFTWKQFYATASIERLTKDIPYGNNNNTLDVYTPSAEPTAFRPVVVFVHGGTWGSGDKDMYGLLCCQLADTLNAIVVCPNHSIYPKGYVDDMVQDVVDCLSWIHRYGPDYGANKEKILLIGHSSGAHLIAMATVELVMKRLLTNPDSLILTSSILEYSRQSSVFTESMQFDEGHFNSGGVNEGEDTLPMVGTSLGGPESASTTGSFMFVDKSQTKSSLSESLLEEVKDKIEQEQATIEEQIEIDNVEKVTHETTAETEHSKGDTEDDNDETAVESEQVKSEAEEEEEETSEPKVDPSAVDSMNITNDELELLQSQREICDLLSSIQAVIGLAGVYHIGDHYEHETFRGVEDISTMAKAMYGADFFERFSPSHIIPNLPHNTRFPPVHLVHGDQDKTVPCSSSTKFSQALWELGSRQIKVSLLPGCGHTDICLDLMDSNRPWYDAVMACIIDTATRYL